MVQAFDRLVMPRAVAALVSAAMLAGCQWLGLHSSDEMDATPACPAVTKAEAWVNRMPTMGDEPTKMIVMLRVDSAESWFLTPLDMPAAQGLILDLKPGGSAVPGTVVYREMAHAPLPSRIAILCRGSEVATISDVMIVQ